MARLRRKIHKGVVLCPYTCADYHNVDWPELVFKAGLNTLAFHTGGDGYARENDTFILDKMLHGNGGVNYAGKAASMGLDVEYEVHVLSSEFLPRHYFKAYPDWFRQDYRTGKRTPQANYCPSSVSASGIVADRGRDFTGRFPSTTARYFLWSDDGGSWCHCSRCREKTDSDQELVYTNTLLAAARKEHPGAGMAYLAYGKQMAPPSSVKPADGVFLEFAPSERCYRHAVNDPKCSVNRHVWNNLLNLLEIFRPEETHVLEYWLDFRRKWYVAKPTIASDIRAYGSLGITSFTTFLTYNQDKPLRKADRDWLDFYGSCFP